MKKFLILCLALFVIGACSDKEEATTEGSDAGTQPAAGPPGEPKPMIPSDEFSELEQLANAHLKPYFDANATQTELAVAPGDRFDLYIVAEYDKNYPMSAAEFRVVLPQGVSILSSTNCDSTIIQFGNPVGDFMMAFRCSYGPKMWLVKHECGVDESFAGGPIKTDEGMAMHFLGFTLCDEGKTLIRAKPGEATLRLKQ